MKYMLLMAGLYFILCLVIVFVTSSVLHRHKVSDNKYDERQRFVQGRAFKCAFFCLLFYNLFSAVLVDVHWCDVPLGHSLGILISITLYASICILHDAYFYVGSRPRFYLIVFSLVGVVNLALGIMNFWDGDYVYTNGMLNYHSLNLFVGLSFVFILIVVVIKLRQNKRELAS